MAEMLKDDKKFELHVEIKRPRNRELRPRYKVLMVAEKIVQLVYKYGLEHNVSIISFSDTALDHVRSLIKDKPVKVGTTKIMDYYAMQPKEMLLKNTGISVPLQGLTPDLIEFLHKHGLTVTAWMDKEHLDDISESKETYQKMAALGVDYINSDYCVKAKKSFEEIEEEDAEKL